MPRDVIWLEEICAPQQRVAFSELDDLAAAATAADDAEHACMHATVCSRRFKTLQKSCIHIALLHKKDGLTS